MSHPKEQTGGFTYADYCSWPEDERWELIDGVAWSMSPAPGRSHQDILLGLARLIANITDATTCETYIAPFDVRLVDDATVGTERTGSSSAPSDEITTTVVQPDIAFFCRPEVLDDAGAHGAPELVVEILSPSTSYKDQTHKLALYERHRVQEYWIVNGDARWVMVYRIGSDNHYGKPDYYRAGPDREVIPSDVLGGAGIAVDSFL